MMWLWYNHKMKLEKSRPRRPLHQLLVGLPKSYLASQPEVLTNPLPTKKIYLSRWTPNKSTPPPPPSPQPTQTHLLLTTTLPQDYPSVKPLHVRQDKDDLMIGAPLPLPTPLPPCLRWRSFTFPECFLLTPTTWNFSATMGRLISRASLDCNRAHVEFFLLSPLQDIFNWKLIFSYSIL